MEMSRRKTDADPMLRDIKALMDLMPAGIRWVNQSGECEHINQAFIDLFGYQLPEIRRMDDWFILAYPNPDYRTEIIRWYSQKIPSLARGTTPPPLQASITCRNGSVKQVIVSAHIAMERVIAIYSDVTDRTEAIKQQREIENMFRLTFEGARDAIFWANAETGILVNCNRAAEELIEAPRNEIIGRHFASLHPPYSQGEILALFESLTTHTDIETEVISRSGRKIPVQIRNSITSIAGTKVIQGVVLDISERRAIEETLRRSEAKYRAMVEAFDGLMYICSKDLRIEFMNLRMMERIGDNATGKICYQALHQFESPCPWCVNERVFNGERVEWEFQSPRDGSWYHIVNNPIRHREGIASKQVTITNITARKQAEQLRISLEAEKIALVEQRQFIGLVSHEIKTPLSVIDGAAQLILLTAPPESGPVQQATRIRAAASRLNELIDSCLTDERLSTTGWNPDMRLHDLRKMAHNAIEQARVGTRIHDITADVSALPDHYICDAMLIKVMINNLLDNAIKYSPEGGTITLRSRIDESGGIQIEVSDQGIGIPPEQVEKIYERFYRTWQVPGVAGAGIGLYLVKRIAGIHKGVITCSSSTGAGSTFTVTLPPNI